MRPPSPNLFPDDAIAWRARHPSLQIRGTAHRRLRHDRESGRLDLIQRNHYFCAEPVWQGWRGRDRLGRLLYA